MTLVAPVGRGGMFACAVVRRSQCVLRLRKAALLACSIVSTGTIVSSAAQADCTHAGPVGPGGEEFFGFLAATSSAATSTVTAMNAGFQTQTGAFLASPGGSQPDQFAGGVWGRAVGGRLDTESMSEGTRIRPAAPQGRSRRHVRPKSATTLLVSRAASTSDASTSGRPDGAGILG